MGYDLLVIGNSNAGRQAALAAGRMGKSVALIQQGTSAERSDCVQIDEHLDAVMPGFRPAQSSGNLSLSDLRRDVEEAAHRAEQFDLELLQRYSVAQFRGTAEFQSPHEVRVTRPIGSPLHLMADRVILACGTRADHAFRVPAAVAERVFVPETLWQRDDVPATWIVIGASRHGLQAARILARHGADVTLIDGAAQPARARFAGLEDGGAGQIDWQTGADVIGLEPHGRRAVRAVLECGRRVTAGGILIATGRCGDTESLRLDNARLQTDEKGRIWCNATQQTWMPHIFGAGDVIGFPASLRDFRESGSNAVDAAFDREDRHRPLPRLDAVLTPA